MIEVTHEYGSVSNVSGVIVSGFRSAMAVVDYHCLSRRGANVVVEVEEKLQFVSDSGMFAPALLARPITPRDSRPTAHCQHHCTPRPMAFISCSSLDIESKCFEREYFPYAASISQLLLAIGIPS